MATNDTTETNNDTPWQTKLVGVIFHMPCLPPPSFSPDRKAIEDVWQQVHTFLDAPAQKLARAPW